MKRAIAAFMTCILLLSFTACGDDSPPFTLGVINGQTYENTFLGLGCTLPDTFAFQSQEELAATNRAAYDLLSEELSEQLKNAEVIYDMFSQDEFGNSVGINVENLGLMSLKIRTAEEYIQNLESSIAEPLEQIGYTNISVTPTTLTFAGQEEAALTATADMTFGEVTMTLHQAYICLLYDEYVAAVCIGAVDQDTFDTLLSTFYRL